MEGENLEDVGVDEMIILKLTLMRKGVHWIRIPQGGF
jgi:hypothetical protein